MTDQDKITEKTVQDGQESHTSTATSSKEASRFVWLAIISTILTIAAWIAGGYNAVAAIVISVAAIVTGAFALKSHRNGVRNTAITSIIAAAVLLVVISAFCIVIFVGLRSV